MTNLDSQPQQQHRLTSDVIFLHIFTLPPLSLALEGETEIRNAVVTAVTLRPEMLGSDPKPGAAKQHYNAALNVTLISLLEMF